MAHQTNYWWFRFCCDLTILKGKKLEDAVHNGDNNSESQQVWVGFQKGHLYRDRKSKNLNFMFNQKLKRLLN